MTIADLKRAYYATHPEGLWFDHGGRRNGRWFPRRTVYGGKYFIEGTTDVLTYKVWRVKIDQRMSFELVAEFIFLALALKYVKEHA